MRSARGRRVLLSVDVELVEYVSREVVERRVVVRLGAVALVSVELALL